MVKEQQVWKFPQKSFLMMRIEVLFLLVLAVLVFIFSFFKTQNWLLGIISTVAFLVIYLVISFVLQRIRKAKYHYRLTPTHLQITKKVRTKIKEDKLPLKEIKHHKLDPFFLGGYVLSHNSKKYGLFFNKRKELEKFKELLKKHLAPLQKRKAKN